LLFRDRNFYNFYSNSNKIMPIYEYKCSECGAHVEKMQKISDAPLTVCEVCGGKLEKQWSLSGIQFKGAGWYVTDYTNKTKDPNATKSGITEKAEHSEKTGESEKTEKTSAAESTATGESASNKANDTAPAASTTNDAAAKKD
jgi:putative FmdB family regulatory protein